MMFVKKTVRIAILTAMLGGVPLVSAQQVQKPLTNDGVVRMVRAGLAESVVVEAIQSSPGKYDISPDGLIALQKAGVTQKEMDAVVAAQKAANGGGSAPAPANVDAGGAGPAPAAASGPRWQMPSVTLLQSGGSQVLPLEKTQLAETKTKPRTLASLSGDSAVTEGIQAGVNDAAWSTASHINSGVGGSAVEQAGGIFGGILARRQPTVTYVWGVPGPASANVLQTATPKFSVNFAKAPGVNPNEFAPEIVKLTPAQNTCRLVGATRGREDARSHDAADWKIYSSFVEDRVAVNLQKTAAGEYQMSPQSALLPGEYAVVLRPISRDEKVSGGDVARGQGPGLMFDTTWSFQVADTAQ
ncbi:MAG: hypothetical protein ACYDCD_03395 [Candidatus Acidiferrales bacterium]